MENNEYILQDLLIAKQLDDYNKGLRNDIPSLNQPTTNYPLPELQVNGNIEKETPLAKLVNGIQNFQAGFNENKNNAFMPSNLTDNKFDVNGEKVNKGFMGKLGEAIGTTARQLNKPIVKGLANGLVSTALTGSPMFGFVSGTNTARDSEKSNVYAKALQEQGINAPQNLFSSYTANDLESLMQPQYKQQELELKKLHEQVLNEWRKGQVQNQEERIANDKEYKQNRIKNEKTKIVNQQKNTKYQPQNEPTWNQDLADYQNRINDPRYSEKRDSLKAYFIKRYGVDPDKYVKN